MTKENKIYLYNFFYSLIILLVILSIPFLVMTYESEYNKVLDEYTDAVHYATSEQFNDDLKDLILELSNEVINARLVKNYKNFISILIVIIFLGLFNYFYIRFGYKKDLIKETASMNLNKKILLVINIFEIIFFVLISIFFDYLDIGTHFWTLFLVNIVLVIFIIVLSLQIEYFLKRKSEE